MRDEVGGGGVSGERIQTDSWANCIDNNQTEHLKGLQIELTGDLVISS